MRDDVKGAELGKAFGINRHTTKERSDIYCVLYCEKKMRDLVGLLLK